MSRIAMVLYYNIMPTTHRAVLKIVQLQIDIQEQENYNSWEYLLLLFCYDRLDRFAFSIKRCILHPHS